MSPVVAMLSGDVEASREISRPGYLTDWRVEDVDCLMNYILPSKGTSSSNYNLSSSISMLGDPGLSSSNAKLLLKVGIWVR